MTNKVSRTTLFLPSEKFFTFSFWKWWKTLWMSLLEFINTRIQDKSKVSYIRWRSDAFFVLGFDRTFLRPLRLRFPVDVVARVHDTRGPFITNIFEHQRSFKHQSPSLSYPLWLSVFLVEHFRQLFCSQFWPHILTTCELRFPTHFLQ